LRIDKFLWCVRIFKTRALAAEAVQSGSVWINGLACKPSKAVKAGDRVQWRRDGIRRGCEVLKVPNSRLGAGLLEAYIADRTDPAELEKLELLLLAHKLNRSRGTGRPTKKDRREIERFDGFDPQEADSPRSESADS